MKNMIHLHVVKNNNNVLELKEVKLCKYGCGQPALYDDKCAKSHNTCPVNKNKNSISLKKLGNDHTKKASLAKRQKVNCIYCNHETTVSHIKIHEKNCYLNPDNLKLCPVCDKPIKNYKTNATCSSKCAREHFSEMYDEFGCKGKELGYRTICFRNHEKRCVHCDEENVVSVHHLDGDHNNNDPYNLIPLCPTHHQYMHSRFKDIVQISIDKYLEERNLYVNHN